MYVDVGAVPQMSARSCRSLVDVGLDVDADVDVGVDVDADVDLDVRVTPNGLCRWGCLCRRGCKWGRCRCARDAKGPEAIRL